MKSTKMFGTATFSSYSHDAEQYLIQGKTGTALPKFVQS